MGTKGTNIGSILRGFRDRKHFTNAQAAIALAVELPTFRSWLVGPCPLAQQEKILPRMGCKNVEEALFKFDDTYAGAKVYHDFFEESEDVFLAHFENALEVRETRMMSRVYAPAPPSPMLYRKRFNQEIYERLKNDKIKIYKIEQVSNLQRAIDLLHNIRSFDPKFYNVKLIPYSPWLPYANFSIFDDRSVITGGYHRDHPKGYPFISYRGSSYARFYLKLFDELGPVASEFSAKPERDRDEMMVQYLRKIPESESPPCKKMTRQKLNKLVHEREKYIEEYKTRY